MSNGKKITSGILILLIVGISIFLFVKSNNKQIKKIDTSNDQPETKIEQKVDDVSKDHEYGENIFDSVSDGDDLGKNSLTGSGLSGDVIEDKPKSIAEIADQTNKENQQKELDLKKMIEGMVLPTECLSIKDQIGEEDYKYCISSVEKKYLSSIKEKTETVCKNLIVTKDKCFNEIYYKKAITERDLLTCEKIQNNYSAKKQCINRINYYTQKANEELAKTQALQEKIAQVEKQVEAANDISSCDSLAGDDKLKCVEKFVIEESDLRYCYDHLDENNAIICSNANWKEVFKANILEFKATGDKEYCEKIYLQDWKNKCLGN